jgi:hypothetical protein
MPQYKLIALADPNGADTVYAHDINEVGNVAGVASRPVAGEGTPEA